MGQKMWVGRTVRHALETSEWPVLPFSRLHLLSLRNSCISAATKYPAPYCDRASAARDKSHPLCIVFLGLVTPGTGPTVSTQKKPFHLGLTLRGPASTRHGHWLVRWPNETMYYWSTTTAHAGTTRARADSNLTAISPNRWAAAGNGCRPRGHAILNPRRCVHRLATEAPALSDAGAALPLAVCLLGCLRFGRGWPHTLVHAHSITQHYSKHTVQAPPGWLSTTSMTGPMRACAQFLDLLRRSTRCVHWYAAAEPPRCAA